MKLYSSQEARLVYGGSIGIEELSEKEKQILKDDIGQERFSELDKHRNDELQRSLNR